jgi:hypothetical protein
VTISDTTPDAAAVQLAILRRIGSEGRLRLAFQASDLARDLFESGVRARNPQMTDEQLKRETIRLLYGVTLKS